MAPRRRSASHCRHALTTVFRANDRSCDRQSASDIRERGKGSPFMAQGPTMEILSRASLVHRVKCPSDRTAQHEPLLKGQDSAQFVLQSPPSQESSATSAASSASAAPSRGEDRPSKCSISSIQRRLCIARETVESEQRYVETLKMIQHNFVEPLVELLRSEDPILTPSVIADIFSNFIDIMYINSAFLTMLQERIDTTVLATDSRCDSVSIILGDTFACFGRYFTAYKIYCRNFPIAIQALDREIRVNTQFRSFLMVEPRKTCLRGMSLHSHLLMPVQRIPRYRMLLKEMLKLTSDKHCDRSDLCRALAVIEEVATGINDSIERQEHWQELHCLEKCFLRLDEPLSNNPTRRLIKRGSIVKIGSKIHERCELFLFNDCLIYGKPIFTSNLLNVPIEYYLFIARLPLSQIRAELESGSTRTSDAQGHKFYWRLISSRVSFIAYCYSADTRDQWVQAIEQAVSNNSMERVLFDRRAADATIGLLFGRQASRLTFPVLRFFASAIHTSEMDYPIFRHYSAPIWIEDSCASKCQQCETSFSLFRGRHHCRICGGVICAACSRKRFMTSSRSPLFRICDLCHKSNASSVSRMEVAPARKLDTCSDKEQSMKAPQVQLGTLAGTMRRAQASQPERKSLKQVRTAVMASIRISFTPVYAAGSFVS